jgi:hypothetical protein
MSVTASALEAKIREIYPELEEYHVSIAVSFDEKADAWVVTFSKNGHNLDTYLEQDDVQACIDGKKCVHMGVQIGRFIENYCLRDGVCPVTIQK